MVISNILLNGLKDSLVNICLTYGYNIVCMGDFHIDTFNIDYGLTFKLLFLMDAFNLVHQLIKVPTLVTER